MRRGAWDKLRMMASFTTFLNERFWSIIALRTGASASAFKVIVVLMPSS